MAIITIDSVPMPSPAAGGYKVSIADLDSENSSRNEAGELSRERIRSGVYKIEITWWVSAADYAVVIAALAPEKISVTFFDPNTGAYQTRDMYTGDRSGSLRTYIDGANPEASQWELTANLTEY